MFNRCLTFTVIFLFSGVFVGLVIQKFGGSVAIYLGSLAGAGKNPLIFGGSRYTLGKYKYMSNFESVRKYFSTFTNVMSSCVRIF